MPRTTKGNLASKKHKTVLAKTKGHYGADLDSLKQLSNHLLNQCNMPTEIEKIEKEILEGFGLLESMLKWET